MPFTLSAWPTIGIQPSDASLTSAVQVYRGPMYVWRFTTGNTISAFVFGTIPSNYAGGTINAVLSWEAQSATSGTCQWSGRFCRMNGANNIASSPFPWGTVSASVLTTAPASLGTVAQTTLVFDSSAKRNSVVAGDPFVLRLDRENAGTMTGGADLFNVELLEA